MTANTADPAGPWVQLPDMTFGVNRYFEFLQRQIKLTGELTATWVSAMNTLSATVLEHDQVGRSSTTEHTLSGSVGFPPLISAWTSRQGTRRVTEPDPDDRPARQEPPSADVFDEVIELLVEDDIIAAVSEQADSR